MTAIARQRCANHPEREAAARCPECGRSFCRECITEHEDRVICAGCLRRLAETSAAARPPRLAATTFGRLLQLGAAVLCAWFYFHLLGRVLLTIPSSFHEGTLWKTEDSE